MIYAVLQDNSNGSGQGRRAASPRGYWSDSLRAEGLDEALWGRRETFTASGSKTLCVAVCCAACWKFIKRKRPE